jgi:hypothetical protein
MGRRTAGVARGVPAAVANEPSCSSSSAVVFTPVGPVDHVAQSGAEQGKGEVPLLYLVESGAASSKCYRDDGEEEVSQLPSPMRSDVKNRMLPHLPHLPRQQNSAAFAGTPFLATELSLARTSRFRRWRYDGRQLRRFVQVNPSMGSTIGPTSSAPPSPRRTASQHSPKRRGKRLRRADSSVTSLRLSSGRVCRGGRCQPRAMLHTRQASGTRGVSVRQS